jgi:hypothetical protein
LPRAGPFCVGEVLPPGERALPFRIPATLHYAHRNPLDHEVCHRQEAAPERPHVRTSALLCAAALAAAACGRDAKGPPLPPPPHVEAVRISAASVVVELMDSTRVSATVHMSDGTLSTRAVQWEYTRPELVRACGPGSASAPRPLRAASS